MKYGGMHIFCQILWNFPEISETDKISYYLYLFISLFHSPPHSTNKPPHGSPMDDPGVSSAPLPLADLRIAFPTAPGRSHPH